MDNNEVREEYYKCSLHGNTKRNSKKRPLRNKGKKSKLLLENYGLVLSTTYSIHYMILNLFIEKSRQKYNSIRSPQRDHFDPRQPV